MPSLGDCRVVLVIGATSGLGRAMAKAIRDLPSKPSVVAAGRRQDRLKELGQEERITPAQLDVALPRDELVASVNNLLKEHPDVSTGWLKWCSPRELAPRLTQFCSSPEYNARSISPSLELMILKVRGHQS
jgi:NAD(P)-dependent dehydrogenase (short-subunit alcohol dehydrogenase family)